MSESVAEQHGSNHKWIIGVSLASALAAGIVGFLIYSAVCPCERTPGGFLFGAAADGPVDDWSFANEVPLCQLQIYAGIRPHSINLNCMSTPAGELYLSCSVCEQNIGRHVLMPTNRCDASGWRHLSRCAEQSGGAHPDGCRLECEDHQTAKLWRRAEQSDTGPERQTPRPLVDVSRHIPILSGSVSPKSF